MCRWDDERDERWIIMIIIADNGSVVYHASGGEVEQSRKEQD